MLVQAISVHVGCHITRCRFEQRQTSFLAGRNFVDQRINFDALTWPVNEALFWIFLSDQKETRQQRHLLENQYDTISKWMTTAPQSARTRPTPPNKELIRLQRLRAELRKVSSASPLLWIRFAFSALRDGITPATYFFREYANWRFDRSRCFGTETISRIRATEGEEQAPPYFSNVKGSRIEGALFDRFFLDKTLISETDWNSEWELLTVSNLPKPRAPRVDIREHVGRKVFQRLEECITLAAKEQRIEGLSKQRKNQKYTATISRAELADELQRRYGKRLACKTSTIIRALSELVTCRKKSN